MKIMSNRINHRISKREGIGYFYSSFDMMRLIIIKNNENDMMRH